MSFKEVNELRKSGRLEEAYELAKQELATERGNTITYQPPVLDPDTGELIKVELVPFATWGEKAIAWVYYDFLKKNSFYTNKENFKNYLREVIDLNLPENEKLFHEKASWQLVKFLFDFGKQKQKDFDFFNELVELLKQIRIPKPSEVYSVLLKSTLTFYNEWNEFDEFIKWWNLDNLREEDYRQEKLPNGKKFMALAERAVIAVSKKLLEGKPSEIEMDGSIIITNEREIDKEEIQSFSPFLDKVIEEHPDFMYPPYYKAKLLIAIGGGNVLETFRPFAKRKAGEFWTWELMAEIVKEDKEKEFACYCKALNCKVPDSFLVKTRQKFAKILIDRKMYQEARTEIKKIIHTREQEEWRIPGQIVDWTKQKWYSESEEYENNKNLYMQHLHVAESILYEDIEPAIGVVEFINKDKKVLNFVVSKTIKGFFKYSKLNLDTQIGDFLKLRLELTEGKSDKFYKVLTAEKTSETPPSEIYMTFAGTLDKKSGNKFGFVKNIFISPDLISCLGVSEADALSFEVKGEAIISYNKRKNEWGWKAIKIESEK